MWRLSGVGRVSGKSKGWSEDRDVSPSGHDVSELCVKNSPVSDFSVCALFLTPRDRGRHRGEKTRTGGQSDRGMNRDRRTEREGTKREGQSKREGEAERGTQRKKQRGTERDMDSVGKDRDRDRWTK